MKKYIALYILSFFILNINAQSTKERNLHYVFPEFTEGIVSYTTGGSEKKMFNYNRLTEEMIFVSNNQNLALSANDLNIIKSIVIEGRSFVVFKDKMVESTENPNLFIVYKANMKENGTDLGYGMNSKSASSQYYNNININGLLYKINLPEKFEITPYVSYWINENGDLQEIKNFSDLKKQYSPKKKLINSYIKENDIDFNDPKQMIALMNYIETL